jgi:hypothetical protein
VQDKDSTPLLEMKKKEEQKPNIALVGERGLREVNAPGVSFKLPEDQSKPFYHEQAKFLCQQFPYLYKPVVEKGA